MIEALREYQPFFILISLALTPATLIACAMVVWLWADSALLALYTRHKSSADWFVLGVIINFIGDFADNLYWGLAWLADYRQHISRDTMFELGVYSNTPFRQVCTVVAAFCHIAAAMKTTSKTFRLLFLITFVSVPLTVALLLRPY